MSVEWVIEREFVDHDEAVSNTESRHVAVAAGETHGLVRVFEFPHMYTTGMMNRNDTYEPTIDIPVYREARAGTWSYHGPGQKVVILNIKTGEDVDLFKTRFANWIQSTVVRLGVPTAFVAGGDRYGVWVPRPDKGRGHEDKIVSVGLKITRFVTSYGFSVNVKTDLRYYDGISPCSVSDSRYGVTSFRDLGIEVDDHLFNTVLREEFDKNFGV
jgi:lipoyl(octanoyl) transferase